MRMEDQGPNLFLCGTELQLKLCLRSIAQELGEDLHVTIVLQDGSLEDIFQGHEDDFPISTLHEYVNEPLSLYRLLVRSVNDIPGGQTENMVHWLSAPAPPAVAHCGADRVACRWPRLRPVGFALPRVPALTPPGTAAAAAAPHCQKAKSSYNGQGADELNLYDDSIEKGGATDQEEELVPWPEVAYQLEVAEGRPYNPSRLARYPSTTVPMDFRRVGLGPNLTSVTTTELHPCQWYFFRLRVLAHGGGAGVRLGAEAPLWVQAVSEVASVATKISVPDPPVRPKAAIELVPNVRRARGDPQWRLRLHWTQPRCNGAPITHYVVQRQVMGDGKDDPDYIHTYTDDGLRPGTAFGSRKGAAAAVAAGGDREHRGGGGGGGTDAEGWLRVYEHVLPECDIPLPAPRTAKSTQHYDENGFPIENEVPRGGPGRPWHRLHLRVAAASAAGRGAFSETLTVAFDKLTALLAEGELLAAAAAKPPKLWLHHGGGSGGPGAGIAEEEARLMKLAKGGGGEAAEDPLLRRARQVQASLPYPVNLGAARRALAQADRARRYAPAQQRRQHRQQRRRQQQQQQQGQQPGQGGQGQQPGQGQGQRQVSWW